MREFPVSGMIWHKRCLPYENKLPDYLYNVGTGKI
jgi:hypothetical protein